MGKRVTWQLLKQHFYGVTWGFAVFMKLHR